jgi:hypothetical protein
MRVKSAFGLIVLAVLALVGPCAAVSRQAQIVCSEDIIPDNMAITATGTSPVCRGSCRARRLEPVRGSIMIICSNQPIPKDYSLDSVTTTPDCVCLGDEDNAYVIRKPEVSEGQAEGEALATPTPAVVPTPIPVEPLPDFRTGE